jgi:hypothetical protein
MQRPSRFLLLQLLGLLSTGSSAAAQAWAYPAFQPPRVVGREFNFGLADAGGAGTTLLFQWREEAGPLNQLSVDAGLADPDFPGSDAMLFIGGQFARQLARSSADMPLDFLFTVGAYLTFGDLTFFRLPVGVSIGHYFALGSGMALTPWVHPRISIDHCGECRDETNLSADFDLGVSLDLTRSLAVRAAILLTGSDLFDDGFGVSLAWKPPGMAALRGRAPGSDVRVRRSAPGFSARRR